MAARGRVYFWQGGSLWIGRGRSYGVACAPCAPDRERPKSGADPHGRHSPRVNAPSPWRSDVGIAPQFWPLPIPNSKPQFVNPHLGVTYLTAGQKAKAVDVFTKIEGKQGGADLGRSGQSTPQTCAERSWSAALANGCRAIRSVLPMPRRRTATPAFACPCCGRD
jgi:hypothetical protein